jgi:hypothetical protein
VCGLKLIIVGYLKDIPTKTKVTTKNATENGERILFIKLVSTVYGLVQITPFVLSLIGSK